MELFVYVAADTVIGVYSTLELAETLGEAKAIERFGVDGFVSEELLDDGLVK